MNKKKNKIFIIGAIPPPIGGVTVHTEKLSDLLSYHNYDVEVFDLSGAKKDINNRDYKVWHYNIRIFTGIMLILRCILMHPQLIHYHVSTGASLFKNKYLYSILIYILHHFKCIITIHSGSFPNFIRNMQKDDLVKANFLLNQFYKIIAVSEEIYRVLVEVSYIPEEKIEIIPAYLNCSDVQVRDIQTVKKDKKNTKIIASGYATSLYWWEGLIKALSLIDNDIEMTLVFYTEYDKNYYAKINNMLRSFKHSIKIYNNLCHSDFIGILQSNDIFIRPTLTDGDSVALREAISMGLRVIASDCVNRPEDCIIFQSENVFDLINKINFARNNLHQVKRESQNLDKNIISFYRDEIG